MLLGNIIATIVLLIVGWFLYGPSFALLHTFTMLIVIGWVIYGLRISAMITGAAYEDLITRNDNSKGRHKDSEIQEG